MTEQGKEPDLYGEPKYSSFPREWHKVPVQWGNRSARDRQVIRLGAIGSIPRVGHISTYFRIGKGQKGAGRFFVEHRRKDGAGRLWLQFYYLRLVDLPQQIKDAIKRNDGRYWDWQGAD